MIFLLSYGILSVLVHEPDCSAGRLSMTRNAALARATGPQGNGAPGSPLPGTVQATQRPSGLATCVVMSRRTASSCLANSRAACTHSSRPTGQEDTSSWDMLRQAAPPLT